MIGFQKAEFLWRASTVTDDEDQPKPSNVIRIQPRQQEAAEPPGEGWPQQSRFLEVIRKVDNEDDNLVRTLRILRMMVQPGLPISEGTWDVILMAAETVVSGELEGLLPDPDDPGEDFEDPDEDQGPDEEP